MEVDPQTGGVPDGWSIIAPTAARPVQAPDAATQREIDLGLRLSPQALQKLHEPLGHPTGIDAIDNMTSPANLLTTGVMGAQALRGIAGEVAGSAAGAGARTLAGARAAITQAAPMVKYEATKTLLEKLGVPSPLAAVAAQAVSAYKKGPTAEPVAEPTASPSPVASSPVVPATPSAPVGGTATPPPTAAVRPSVPVQAPSGEPVIRMGPDGLLVGRPGGNPSMPDQRALNEAALAARRAEYQAKAAAQTPAPAAKPMLQASEAKEYLRLLKSGMSHADAIQTIQTQRELVQSMGLKTPTAAETRFPKGMRGGRSGEDD